MLVYEHLGFGFGWAGARGKRVVYMFINLCWNMKRPALDRDVLRHESFAVKQGARVNFGQLPILPRTAFCYQYREEV